MLNFKKEGGVDVVSKVLEEYGLVLIQLHYLCIMNILEYIPVVVLPSRCVRFVSYVDDVYVLETRSYTV